MTGFPADPPIPSAPSRGGSSGATLPRVLLIATGGTISMGKDSAGGVVPRLSGREILTHVPDHERFARMSVREFGRFPGPHMTIERMWDLRAAVTEAMSDVDGIVITHGTDTIEETAYLLDRSLDPPIPVVVTGAMRNISELSWDGPANLMAAIHVAAHTDSARRGVVVVMDERIVQGCEVVKTHTDEFGTFQSPNWGPLGIVDHGQALFYRESRRKPVLAPVAPVLPVDLIKLTAGADSRLLDASRESGAAGVVVEALGRGNVPEAAVAGIERYLRAGLPVVITSRSLRGRVLDTYAYPGGGHQLRELGVIFGDHLTGQQARIELMLALGVFDYDIPAIKQGIEGGRYDR